MHLIDPASCQVLAGTGDLSGGTGGYAKHLSELSGLYGDAAAYAALLAEGDAVVYEVSDYRPSAAPGDLIFGITRMRPGRVGNEFFLTRGHIHARPDRSEIYVGQAGEGLMLLEAPEGETRVVEIAVGTVCYVPPFWIHRSVNTGAADFVTMFCAPADSGNDYSVIERSGGMRRRVVATADGWALVDNPDYRPRSPEAARALAAATA
jgi:glucose-6-phosphate isomerase